MKQRTPTKSLLRDVKIPGRGTIVALAVLATIAATPAAIAQGADGKRPNILIIMGDDIGWFNLSIHNRGIMGYKTPNIDRLAKEGANLNAGNINYMTLKAAAALKRLQQLESFSPPVGR